MNERDPELVRMLELYRKAKAPQPEVRERVWDSVRAETRGGPEAGTAPSHSGTIKLVLLASAIVGLGGLWMASEGSWSRFASEPVAEPAPPVARLPQADARRPPADVARQPEADATHARAQPAVTTIEASGTVLAPSDRHTHAPRTATRTGADRPQASSLAEELELLTAAQRAAHRRGTRAALALLDEHGRRFPDGAMAEEREAERVAALCALGRDDEAQRVAQAFLVRFVGSPQSARVSRACAAPEGSP